MNILQETRKKERYRGTNRIPYKTTKTYKVLIDQKKVKKRNYFKVLNKTPPVTPDKKSGNYAWMRRDFLK